MRILVFSDTHGRAQGMIDVISSEPHDLVVHLGDCVRDVYELQQALPDEKIRFVAGNDLHDMLSGAPRRDIFRLEKYTVLMTHGHDYRVSAGVSRLAETAQAVGADLVLYGHTHVPHIETRGGITYFNPGSCSLDRSGLGAGWGLVTIEGDRANCELMFF